ncbi:MAG: hypothetical protein LBP51_05295, partial [Deferribacteraceae bacterium]|nr:hypothetical protein [Deferribacteraceae bacterium]
MTNYKPVAAGVVIRTFGVKGELRVSPLISDELFSTLKRCTAAGKSYEIVSARPQKNHWLIRLAGVAGESSLAALIGE